MLALIFSKDRACQLQALIRSIKQNSDLFYIKVLYTTSSPVFEDGYKKLKKQFPEIQFVTENGFRNSTLDLIERGTDLICPFVDDDIVYRKIDFTEEEIFTIYHHIPKSVVSLRLGENIRVSDNFTNPEIQLPDYQILEFNGRQLYRCCKKVSGHHPFGYPISVDGHIFTKNWLLHRCQEIPFSTPNFLEGNLQRFNDEFEHIIFPPHSYVTSIPANRVQSEFENKTIGNISSEELNEKWLSGEEIDLDQMDFSNVNCTHSNIEYRFHRG